MAYSPLQKERLLADCNEYLPTVLEGCPVAVKKEAVPASAKDADTIKGLFPSTYDMPLVEFAAGTPNGHSNSPIKVGVVLSGGQAPGGHNVIAGIFDGVKNWHPDSTMIGFLDGPHGIFTGTFVEITKDIMDSFRNTGGFDMLGSGRHKIETEEQFKNSLEVCKGIDLDGLVVIGGDDSNTNGALLAEYFKANGCKTKVVGAPKTIDGDLKCPPHIPVSFGFDTACKTYSTLVGNVAVDALSAQKYYHLVRLMGRSASNIALEVALTTRPNVCLLGEEVEAQKKSLRDLTVELANMVEERSKLGKDYGVIVLPEGLIEFIPEFNSLISELNDKLAASGVETTEESVLAVLSPENAASFKFLPAFIRAQLLLDRDPHGNVQVAKIETEKLLAATVAAELEERRSKGTYKGTFSPQFHAYGYEGRAGMPTIFDSSYCYALGATAAALLANGLTGLIASVKNLLAPVKQWQCGGVPITSLCVIERRKGKDKPVIRKALVELDGPMSQPFVAYKKIREQLLLTDSYCVPGPVQFDMQGCPVSTAIPITLQLELGKSLAPVLESAGGSKRLGKILYAPQQKKARSDLQQWRMQRPRTVPGDLQNFSIAGCVLEPSIQTAVTSDKEIMQKFFSQIDAPLIKVTSGPVTEKPANQDLKIGVLFSGRQSPGCHDLLCGLADMIGSAGKLIGFVGGTKGLFGKHSVELTREVCADYKGTGGLDLLGRTVDRIKSDEELELARKSCSELGLKGLVIVGGTRSNSDAAFLSEHFKKQNQATAVIGVPCGMEGSMVNEFVEASIGFDTSTKAISSLVGNTAIDGSSARKYYYFLKVMDGSSTGGKLSTSHVALEVALQTKPNMALLTEEVDEKRQSLRELVQHIADVVAMRAAAGKNFGTILVAEGLLEAIPEFRNLIHELEAIPMPCPVEKVMEELTQWSRALYQSLPEFIQKELLMDRQSNASLQISALETERLIAELVEEEMKQRKKKGTFKGSFSPVCQFLGYQARCSMPSDFDSDYAYALGGTAALLGACGKNGYMAVVSDLSKPVKQWKAGGVPFTAMMNVAATNEYQGNWPKPAILPQLVDLHGAAFQSWCKLRADCAKCEMYENPGPIQFSGPSSRFICDTITTRFSYIEELSKLHEKISEVSKKCRPGCDPRKVRVANQSLATLNSILDELTRPLTNMPAYES
jgi:6-phosphofructokinase 1